MNLASFKPLPPLCKAHELVKDTMSPFWYALRLIQAFEDRIIESVRDRRVLYQLLLPTIAYA